ncbi:Glutathione S-transferase P 10 [Cladophialophora carrionii]|uniref:Glutathione S-transferase P 10 n=1 Tax=Cladophialophora carrionii TaxID=86049 RepID=A0A1C1C891_9EURO|nr:Glutathione S-transferase P 10 [Cladophialophora carrionii]
MAAATKTPILYYFDLGSKGRGEVVRVFLRELGIDFEDKRYAYDETWQPLGKEFQQKGLSLTGKLPVLDIDGHILSQHIPILRYLSRSVGGYDGTSNYDKWLVDAVSDIYVDWREKWVANLSGKAPNYKSETVPYFYSIWDKLYSRNAGPYLLGNQVTYVDFAVFQALDNDEAVGAAPASVPETLKALRKAVSERPNIKEYIAARA